VQWGCYANRLYRMGRMLGTDPWHHYRKLKRASIVGVSVFLVTDALVATFAQMHMRSPALLIPFGGWMIFGLVITILSHQIRCPRCGPNFTSKEVSIGRWRPSAFTVGRRSTPMWAHR